MGSNNNNENGNGGIDWHRIMLRKDRPLPKAGCSWAFYAGLLAIVVYLVVMWVKYKNT